MTGVVIDTTEPDGVAERPGRVTPMARMLPKASPWAGRALFIAMGLLLVFVWPDVVGDPTRVRQWAEYLCYAMVAVGLDIAWGYGGMLALGQGVFFGLGAYSMGMYLSLENVPDGALPEFMALYSDYDSLPWLWKPFEHLWFAWTAALIVPMLVAALIGMLVFPRRIRGPYFALLTQATALIFWLILVNQLPLTAGTNGLTNFQTVFGRNKYDPGTNEYLYVLAAVGLLAVLVVARWFVRSRMGRLLVATKDSEDRVRFLGYDPAVTKTIAFAVAAGMAGVAGAMSAPIIGIVAPNQFAVLPSILIVCWVAVGGRGTLFGAALGALLVNWGRTKFSESRPDDWLYLQGALFVVIVGFVPRGILGIPAAVRDKVTELGGRFGGLRHRPADATTPGSAVSAVPADGGAV